MGSTVHCLKVKKPKTFPVKNQEFILMNVGTVTIFCALTAAASQMRMMLK